MITKKTFLTMLLAFGFSVPSIAAEYKIRWAMNHTPKSYFIETAEVFRKAVEQKTKGKVTVIAQTENEELESAVLLKQVRSGQIEMAQVYTADIGEVVPSFNVFDLPYLFENHRQAKRVFEGPVGSQLLAQLEDHGAIGLGFTYSGGFVVRLGFEKAIQKIEDLKAATIAPLKGKYNQLSLKALGLEIVEPGKANFTSATYADLKSHVDLKRFTPEKTIINETKDRLLVTGLVMNKDFFNRLPTQYQKAVREAAHLAARAERKIIIDSGRKVKKDLVKQNYKVVQLPASEKLKWEKSTKDIYSRFYGEYADGAQLVRDIRKSNKDSRLANR